MEGALRLTYFQNLLQAGLYAKAQKFRMGD